MANYKYRATVSMLVVKGKQMCSLWLEMGELIIWDMDKTEILNGFFCHILNQEVLSSHTAQDAEHKGRVGEN